MHRKFQELLHEYKLDVFKVNHDQKDVEAITQECMDICEDVLHQKYSYHFHKLPDANRAEIINMISNYTREAILPPVVESIVHRHVVLEKRLEAMESLIARMLETLSTDPVSTS